jgi:hypothetical protein
VRQLALHLIRISDLHCRTFGARLWSPSSSRSDGRAILCRPFGPSQAPHEAVAIAVPSPRCGCPVTFSRYVLAATNPGREAPAEGSLARERGVRKSLAMRPEWPPHFLYVAPTEIRIRSRACCRLPTSLTASPAHWGDQGLNIFNSRSFTGRKCLKLAVASLMPFSIAVAATIASPARIPLEMPYSST